MNKYINAAELKLILNREHLNYSQMIEKKFVLNAIDEMPSADVAEVVRCKDCKHCEHQEFPSAYVCFRRIDEECVFEVDDDFYCTYGERRDT